MKHSLFSIYYSNKRKTHSRYGLKTKIKVHDLKNISGSILLCSMFLWWYRSFTKGLFTTKISFRGEFCPGLNLTRCMVNPLPLFTTMKLKKRICPGVNSPRLSWPGWNSHPGPIDVKWVGHACFHSPRGDMLHRSCIFTKFF